MYHLHHHNFYFNDYYSEKIVFKQSNNNIKFYCKSNSAKTEEYFDNKPKNK